MCLFITNKYYQMQDVLHNHQYFFLIQLGKKKKKEQTRKHRRVRDSLARTEGIPHHYSWKVHAGHTIHDDENPGIRQVTKAVIEANYKRGKEK